jgi:16S rRNA U516 pseudouridylate synthase RsuA-like enzyme
MSEEEFNMSLRKFLKQVGVTSQRQIEKLVRGGKAGEGSLRVKMVLTAEGTQLNHEVSGIISLP